MQRLSETECEIIELLQKAREEVSKGSILASLNGVHSLTGKYLERLVRNNYISEKEETGFTYYFISEQNRQMKSRKVKCPKCGNERRVFNENQFTAICKNRDCTWKNGMRTVFWVLSRKRFLSEGKRILLNQA